MSLSKKIERNVDAYLAQFDHQLAPGWRNLPFERKNLIANMSRNGITPRDLDKARLEARNEAYQETAPAVMQVVYCAVGIVLREEYGFNTDQIYDALKTIDDKITVTLASDEIVDEMIEKCNIRVSTKEGVGRIEKMG